MWCELHMQCTKHAIPLPLWQPTPPAMIRSLSRLVVTTSFSVVSLAIAKLDRRLTLMYYKAMKWHQLRPFPLHQFLLLKYPGRPQVMLCHWRLWKVLLETLVWQWLLWQRFWSILLNFEALLFWNFGVMIDVIQINVIEEVIYNHFISIFDQLFWLNIGPGIGIRDKIHREFWSLLYRDVCTFC